MKIASKHVHVSHYYYYFLWLLSTDCDTPSLEVFPTTWQNTHIYMFHSLLYYVQKNVRDNKENLKKFLSKNVKIYFQLN